MSAVDSPFWRALVEYFDRFAFGNAEADDLFNILVKVSYRMHTVQDGVKRVPVCILTVCYAFMCVL